MSGCHRDRCDINHQDATCRQCAAEHVEIGWLHICEPCWRAELAATRSALNEDPT